MVTKRVPRPLLVKKLLNSKQRGGWFLVGTSLHKNSYDDGDIPNSFSFFRVQTFLRFEPSAGIQAFVKFVEQKLENITVCLS
jgi:hypothetical protein